MKRIATFVSGLMVGGLLFGGSFAWGGLMAEESYTPFYLNGQPVEVKAYLINGNNYFRLRDIAALVDFGVAWEQATGSVYIDTTMGYTPENTEQGQLAGTIDHSVQANPAIFQGEYTRELYNLLRECILAETNRTFDYTPEKRQMVWNVEAAAVCYPGIDVKSTDGQHAYLSMTYPAPYLEGKQDCAAFLERVKDMDTYKKIYAAACEVCKQLDYEISSTTGPADLFKPGLHYGNCMSYAHGFKFLCNLLDIPCVFVHSESHQWNEVLVNGVWYAVDLANYDISYTYGHPGTLLIDRDTLKWNPYRQTEPELTLFAKELVAPGSTK